MRSEYVQVRLVSNLVAIRPAAMGVAELVPPNKQSNEYCEVAEL